MRTTLLVCACLASFALGSRVPAQDCATTGDTVQGPACGDPADGAACDEASNATDGYDPVDDDGMVFYDPATGAVCSKPLPGMSYYAKRAAALSGDPCDSSGAGGHGHGHGHLHALKKKLYQHCLNKHHCNGNGPAYRRAMQTPWHGDYYQPEWGAPVALVVPPTAEFQTNYSWGVPASRISPIDHQFSRNYYGTGYGGFGTRGFMAPPFQPSDTNQFGVYYVRGPW